MIFMFLIIIILMIGNDGIDDEQKEDVDNEDVW